MEDDITLNTEKTHSTIIKLPASTLQRLHDYCASSGTSISDVIRDALEKDTALQEKLSLPRGYRTPKPAQKRKAS